MMSNFNFKPEDLADMQGFIGRGYGDLPAAYYVLLTIDDASKTKRWLRHLAEEIEPWKPLEGGAFGGDDIRYRAIHIALTRSGLEKLGLKKNDTLFSAEFEQGMTTEHKKRILGDECRDDDPGCGYDPKDWQWGGTGEGAPQVDILLMLFAGPPEAEDAMALDKLQRTVSPTLAEHEVALELIRKAEAALESHFQFHYGHFMQAGVSLITKLSTRTLIKRKEHFGFHDGIAQPIIDGTPLAAKLRKSADADGKTPLNVIAAGEFVLGYPNEYNKIPLSPLVPKAMDPNGLLPSLSGDTSDFGRNGTYLVFRQLEQDVKAFWEYLDAQTRNNGASDPQARDLLGAKMVGRWRSGAPLVKTADVDKPEMQFDDDFGFKKADTFGDKCPLGSHIRRANPRDAVMPGTSDPITIARVHRILRRGRAYGEPVAESMEPEDILKAPPPDGNRGLHFLCINTDLGRQFEFVQHTWLNNQKFSGLYSELDPIVGAPHPRHRGDKGAFTVQTTPVRQRVTGVERYVHIRGGAYFFMPGLNALRFLVNLPD